MRVLWGRGPATVAEVVAGLTERPRPAYNTVQTMLRILERKNHISHEQRGRAFVYRPLIKERDARQRAIRYLLARLFNGSPELLMLNLLEDHGFDTHQIATLKRAITRREREV